MLRALVVLIYGWVHCLYWVSIIEVVTRGGFSELDFSNLAGIGDNTVTLASYDCVLWGYHARFFVAKIGPIN